MSTTIIVNKYSLAISTHYTPFTTTMDLTTPKRIHKVNWTEGEPQFLVELCKEHVDVLIRKKQVLWETIAQEINKKFSKNRTKKEVKKRWFTIVSKSLQNLKNFNNHRARTGK